MTKSLFQVLTVGVGLAIAPAAYAEPQCKPVVGSFEAQVVTQGCTSPILCTAGRVWGGMQGTYAFTMTSAQATAEVAEVPGILFFTGRSTVSLKSGDQVFGIDTGAIDQAGEGGFASLITFKGGTGAAGNATGQIRLRGEFDPQHGTTSGDYFGTLCTP
jgi:hypothetical protein